MIIELKKRCRVNSVMPWKLLSFFIKHCVNYTRLYIRQRRIQDIRKVLHSDGKFEVLEIFPA